MKTSPAGRAAITQREGKRLSAYRDTVGVWTIGVGHTGRMAPPLVMPGMTITEAQCDDFLAADLAPVEAAINAAVNVPMSQNEFDAMASLGFNIGAAGLRGSTVVRMLNVGDDAGAANAFMHWSKPAVLVGRRRAERTQFLTPDAPNAAGISRSRGVAIARARSLTGQAKSTKRKAKTTQTAGGALALGGAAAAAATSHAGHAHLGLWIAAIVILGALLDGLLAWTHHIQAETLAGNAAKQVDAAVALASAPNPWRAASPFSPPADPRKLLMQLVVFAILFTACLGLWSLGAPAVAVFVAAMAAWIAFSFIAYPKVRTYKIAMCVDDKLKTTEAAGWRWIALHLAGLKVVVLGFLSSMVPFLGTLADWLEGKDLTVFFGPDRGPRVTFYVGAIAFALPFLMSWLHVGAIKDAAVTEPKG